MYRKKVIEPSGFLTANNGLFVFIDSSSAFDESKSKVYTESVK
jgi:hypothetical protein